MSLAVVLSSGGAVPLNIIIADPVAAHTRQFEMVRLGLSPETPVACQQWTGLIAINYPARAFGITRHMTVDEVRSTETTYACGDAIHAYFSRSWQKAKKKCPELVAVQ